MTATRSSPSMGQSLLTSPTAEPANLIDRHTCPTILVKKRIARPGQGKSGGFRTIVATNYAGRWFFVYGFAKIERSTIDVEEEAALKKLAKTLLMMAPAALSKAEKAGEVMKVNCDA